MRKLPLVTTVLSILLIFALSFMGFRVNAGEEGHMKMEQKGHQEGAAIMDDEHGHVEVPHNYKGKTNPYWTQLKDIIAGSSIYKVNCVICHGEDGKGDGVLAKTLNPKPADFTKSTMMAETGDDYLLWRVSEGGQMPPFNSAMPSFKGILSEDKIWQVIAYIHAFSHIKLLEHRTGEKIP